MIPTPMVHSFAEFACLNLKMHPVAIQVKTEVAEVGPSPTTTPTPPSFFQRKRKRGMASPDAPSLSDSQSDGGDHEKEKEESPVKKTRPPPSAAEPIDLTVSGACRGSFTRYQAHALSACSCKQSCPRLRAPCFLGVNGCQRQWAFCYELAIMPNKRIRQPPPVGTWMESRAAELERKVLLFLVCLY